jgi:uncharacterized metal-binding protein YceD (DUF177 family)
MHRPVALDQIGPAGLEVEVHATAAECRALASRMGIPAVVECRCRFRLTGIGAGVVLAEGHLTARVVRDCVVTLDPFETLTEERFRLRFVPPGTESDDADPEADDEIAIAGASIDLGEVAAEQLALALDPYPRKPDAALPETDAAAPEKPFAALARLQPRR